MNYKPGARQRILHAKGLDEAIGIYKDAVDSGLYPPKYITRLAKALTQVGKRLEDQPVLGAPEKAATATAKQQSSRTLSHVRELEPRPQRSKGPTGKSHSR